MPETGRTVTYAVHIPLDATPRLQEFLQNLGARFEPGKNAVYFSETGEEPSILLGYQAPDLHQEINAFLEENRLQPRMKQEPKDWDNAQVHELLELASGEKTAPNLRYGIHIPAETASRRTVG